LAPALCSLLLTAPIREEETAVVRKLRTVYTDVLKWSLDHQAIVIGLAVVVLVPASCSCLFSAGSSCRFGRRQFMGARNHALSIFRLSRPVIS
jgi:Cu/Ag efflux pump CusA